MAFGHVARMLGVCTALLLSCAANAAMLTDPDALPSDRSLLADIGRDSAERIPTLLSGWADGAKPSGTAGGAFDTPGSTWAPQQTPTGPDGQRLAPTFIPRTMLGGLSGELRGDVFIPAQNPPSPVPLPAALWLFASGAAALTPWLRRRTRRASTPRA